ERAMIVAGMFQQHRTLCKRDMACQPGQELIDAFAREMHNGGRTGGKGTVTGKKRGGHKADRVASFANIDAETQARRRQCRRESSRIVRHKSGILLLARAARPRASSGKAEREQLAAGKGAGSKHR